MGPRTGLDFGREKSLAPARIQTLVHLAHSLVSIPNMLLQLP